MANQVEVSISARVLNGSLDKGFEHPPGSYEQVNQGADDPVVTVGAAETTISFANLTTPSLIVLHNLSDTAIVTWGPDSGGVMVGGFELAPGRTSHVYAASGLILKMLSDTAGTKVRVFMLEA